ncbi:hypothetical protein ULMS_19290 [Patiriisocius marinistellae]|uniref:Uncharacterized protein n=1 Tax=Patiriisocius marinistellae TaxID=2494560 RepID=A0A5J4G2K2_9FLAO|nr:hypothetical protein [Patiriisocius marinistellae]GEQ86421.1 hypothetical protein ULMS_19290 [Patiriisocius marinistellae]
MQLPKYQILDFIKSEFEKAKFTITPDESRVEGLDFIIFSPKGKEINLHLQSINLDKEKTIKILKSNLGVITSNRFLGLVLIIENEPRIFYLIPAKALAKPDNRIFFENNVSIMPHLSNWEIKIFTSAIPELAKFEISNFYSSVD